MNNTKTLAAIAAIFIAATLVVGGTFAALTATPSALAYQKKKVEGDKNSKNGNTITIQKCKQDETASGFDNTGEQECGNTICTHPGDNATCVSENEGSVTSSTSSSGSTTPIPVGNTVPCANPVPLSNCCFIVQNNTPGGTQTASGNTCTITVTCSGNTTPPAGVSCANVPPTGSTVATSALSLKSSDEQCNNGASGLLNTGTGKTFSVCVNV
jgi:hypothetical protein